MRDALIHAAERDFLHPEQMVARIEKNDAQRFLVEGPHFSRHQVVDQLGRIELLPRQALIRQALAETEGGDKLNRFRFANAANRLDFFYGAPAQAGERFVLLQELASDLDCIGAGQRRSGAGSRSAPGRSARRAAAEKFFARPLVLRHLADFYLSHSKSAWKGGGSLHRACQMCPVSWLGTKLIEQFPERIPELEK